MSIYLGSLRGGWAGLVLGGVCFILPSAIFVTTLAWVYVRFGSLPQLNAFLYAAKPVIIAIIARALWRYSVGGLKTALLLAIAIAATIVGSFARTRCGSWLQRRRLPPPSRRHFDLSQFQLVCIASWW